MFAERSQDAPGIGKMIPANDSTWGAYFAPVMGGVTC
jgi:hypothetical protein